MSIAWTGRKEELEQLFGFIDDKEPAILLNGDEGVGKTSFLAIVATRLKNRKYHVIRFRGEISAEMILKELAQYAAKKGVKEAETVFEAKTEYKEKLDKLMEMFFHNKKILLLFDDFDANQEEEEKIKNPRLAELIDFLKETLKEKKGLMVFASAGELKDVPTVYLDPLSWSDFKELAAKTSRIGGLDEKSLETIYFEMGGYPRALHLADRIAQLEFGENSFQWPQLRDIVPGLSQRVLHKDNEKADFSYLLLEYLFSRINPRQRKFLEALSVYRGPVPKQVLSAHGVSIAPADRRELEDIYGIRLEGRGKEAVYDVPRLTSRLVRAKMQENHLDGHHATAAKALEKAHSDYYRIESRRHYLSAGDADKAAQMTFDMDNYYCGIGFPQLAFDLLCELLSHVSGMKPANKLFLHNRLGMMFSLFGKLDEAYEQYEASLSLNRESGNNSGIALDLGHMGMIHEARGKYQESLEQYKQSLEVLQTLGDPAAIAGRLEQIANIHKLQGQYDDAFEFYKQALELNRQRGDQKAEGANLEQLGRVHDEQGKFDIALDYYHQSIHIREAIDDRPGLAALKHQLGNVHFVKGDLDTAYDFYNLALTLNEELGDRKSAGFSRGQIGLIRQRKGNIDEALTFFEQSLEDFKSVDEQKGMASGHHQVGRIYQSRGDLDTALDHYEKALELRESGGDMLGAAITYGQLGLLFFEKQELETALRNSVKAYAIFTKYGSPNVQLARQNMLRIRAQIGEEKFNAILAEFNIKTDSEQSTVNS